MTTQKIVRFSIAETQEQREAVYRLRYRVFAEELGADRYADHENRIWIDEDDGPQSITLAGWTENDEAIATMRLCCMRNHRFIGFECYQLAILGEHVALSEESLIETVAKVDRVAILKPFRASGHLIRLQRCAEETARAHKCKILIGSVDVRNERSIASFQALGWKVYCKSSVYRDLECMLVFKCI